MKRIISLMCAVVGLTTSLHAQPDTWPWNAIEVINYGDTHMSRYMYHPVINLNKTDTVNGYVVAETIIYENDQNVPNYNGLHRFSGLRYIVDTPQTIYGIAMAIPYGHNTGEFPNPHPDLSFGWTWNPPDSLPIYLGRNGFSVYHDTSFYAMVVQKTGNTYTRIDSVQYRYYPIMTFFNIGSLVENNCVNNYLYMVEFYFDHPVTVHDTFYIGPGHAYLHFSHLYAGRRYSNPSIMCIKKSMNTSIARSMCDSRWLQLLGNELYELPYHEFMEGIDTVPVGWPVLFPIIAPRPACNEAVEGFQFTGLRVGLPVFSWELPDPSYGYDIEFAQKDQPFDQRYRIPVTTPPYTIQHPFDSTVYYKARIRGYCSPVCSAHNPIVPGPWSDSILFYTGMMAPDTTTQVITPQQQKDRLFLLVPNPAKDCTVVRATNGIKHLVVTDALGHTVINRRYEGVPQEVEIVLSGLPSGIYTVQVETMDDIATEKLMVE